MGNTYRITGAELRELHGDLPDIRVTITAFVLPTEDPNVLRIHSREIPTDFYLFGNRETNQCSFADLGIKSPGVEWDTFVSELERYDIKEACLVSMMLQLRDIEWSTSNRVMAGHWWTILPLREDKHRTTYLEIESVSQISYKLDDPLNGTGGFEIVDQLVQS